MTVPISLPIYFMMSAKSLFRLIGELMPILVTFGKPGIKSFIIRFVVSLVISDIRRLGNFRRRVLLNRSRKNGLNPLALALPANGPKP